MMPRIAVVFVVAGSFITSCLAVAAGAGTVVAGAVATFGLEVTEVSGAPVGVVWALMLMNGDPRVSMPQMAIKAIFFTVKN